MSDTKLHCPFCRAALAQAPAAFTPLRCGSCLRLFTADDAHASQSKSPLDASDSTAAVRAHARTLNLQEESQAMPPKTQRKLSDISRPTVALPAPPSGRWPHFFRAAGLSAAALLLCLTLAAQILWAQRDRYQLRPHLYPLFATACELLACSVPAFVDIGALRGDELSVAASEADTLTLSFRLLNEAPLPQAPPILIVSFSTPSQRSVALREFAPEEYLPASRAPQRPLDPDESIDISLALVDPGPDAVNYTLGFRAP